MILLLPEDLIDKNNFKKVYDLIDSICLGINFPVIDENGNKIGIKELKRREALKDLKELGETKVLENYKKRLLLSIIEIDVYILKLYNLGED